MSSPPEMPGKRELLDARIESEERGLVDRAAKARRKPNSDFILDAECLAAEEAMLDQMLIVTSRETYAEFLTRLDQPPQLNERLRKTMLTPAPWDKA